jgi:hypothetical protein
MGTRIRTTVSKDGFAFLASYMPGTPTLTALSNLGSVVRLAGLDSVQELRPRRVDDAPPNIYSGNFGYAPFPLHTDLAHWLVPPPYFALRCIEGTPAVTTRLVGGLSLIGRFGDLHLRRTLLRPRRPVQRVQGLLRLLERDGAAAPRLRWDTLFLTPASLQSHQMCSDVQEYLDLASSIDFSLCQPGDTLIVDNWRMLHGRSAVPETSSGRILHRAYLKSLQ